MSEILRYILVFMFMVSIPILAITSLAISDNARNPIHVAFDLLALIDSFSVTLCGICLLPKGNYQQYLLPIVGLQLALAGLGFFAFVISVSKGKCRFWF